MKKVLLSLLALNSRGTGAGASACLLGSGHQRRVDLPAGSPARNASAAARFPGRIQVERAGPPQARRGGLAQSQSRCGLLRSVGGGRREELHDRQRAEGRGPLLHRPLPQRLGRDDRQHQRAPLSKAAVRRVRHVLCAGQTCVPCGSDPHRSAGEIFRVLARVELGSIRTRPSPCNINSGSGRRARRSCRTFPRRRNSTWRNCPASKPSRPPTSPRRRAGPQRRAGSVAGESPRHRQSRQGPRRARARRKGDPQPRFADLGRAGAIIGHGTVQNGWARPGVVGEYGLDYLARTLVNNGGIWANIKPEVLYIGRWTAPATISAATTSTR